jgi:hypothetical protein
MSRCPEPKSDADVRSFGCVAMISTLHSVWLRPAVLGGFGGMSDRSFESLSSVRLASARGGGRRYNFRAQHSIQDRRAMYLTSLMKEMHVRNISTKPLLKRSPKSLEVAQFLIMHREICTMSLCQSCGPTWVLETSTCLSGIHAPCNAMQPRHHKHV